MALTNFFDRFRQAPTPEAEVRKTTMQLLDDEKFLDFLDKVEAQSGTRVFAGLNLDEPASDLLMEHYGRYKDQQRVAEQVIGGVKQEFREAGLKFDENLKLPSNKPYRDRYVAFFYPPLGSELADAIAGLPDTLKTKLEAEKQANLPDAQNNHPGGTDAEDGVANDLRTEFEAYRSELGSAEAAIQKMKVDAGLDAPVFSNLADDHITITELTAMEGKLNSFVVDGVTSPDLVSVVEQHRTALKSIVDAERAKITAGSAASPDLAKELVASVKTQEDTSALQAITAERNKLDTVDISLTETYQAKETMGSRMEAIRAQVQEQAISNPHAFDSLKEKMAVLEAKDKEVQALRRQMEQHGLDDQGKTRELVDMRHALKAVDKFGSHQPLLGSIRRIFSSKYRNAARNLEENYGFSPDVERAAIRDQIAGIENLLQTPSSFQRAKSAAEALGTEIQNDVPALSGFGDAVRVALQESLKEKLASGNMAGVTSARKQLENVGFATLINGGVDVDRMKQMIEDTSRLTFQKNLLEQLEAKGGKNISTILRGFENLAKSLHNSKSIESQDLLDFVKASLDQVVADTTLSERTRKYAELIRNTVEARYS